MEAKLSTNYYLVTSDISESGVDVKVRKHIGKSASYFIFQVQPEWMTVAECFDFLELVLSRHAAFRENHRYDTYRIEDEYGDYVSIDELREVVKDAQIKPETFTQYYEPHKGHYVDSGFLFSFSEFT